MKASKVRIIATGEIKTVKSYGNGFIDAKGDFYHKTEVVFVGVVE